MGKKQHQKDKLYLTTTEWGLFYGGKKATQDTGENSKFRRLPFFCCSLSLQPFEHPYCTPAGVIYDLFNIQKFLKKYGRDPATGEKLHSKDLIKLNFFKNQAGKYHCPTTFKVFNENTHIVAIRTTGNVFCYDAVERLNIKPGHWKDLVSDEPFVRKDIITIQDPSNLDKFNMANFYHLRQNLKLVDEEEEAARKDPRYNLNAVNSATKAVLDELESTYKPPEKTVDAKPKADSINAAHYSTGRVAASFTSTAMVPETEHEAAIIDEDVIRYERVKKKAYVRLTTSHGNLNLELHSDMVPKTCENFVKHCLNGYYNNTVFHRSIRNFMIQGGDPEGTGKGGESIWGAPFNDEFRVNLTHSGRGILSMANAGPNSNKSQFFILYRSAPHLNRKHSVFGRVVGGLDTLDKMEHIETDADDRPVEEIKILECQVFVNPYDEVDQMLKSEREAAKQKEEDEKKKAAAKLKSSKSQDSAPKVFGTGVGKYIIPDPGKRQLEEKRESEKKKPKLEELSETEKKRMQKLEKLAAGKTSFNWGTF